MLRLVSDEEFYGAEAAKLSQSTIDPAMRTRYWRNAIELYTVPPRISLEGAVTALGLYSDEAGSKDLQTLARGWLDMSLVDELYPPRT
jgi:hypothetical protein